MVAALYVDQLLLIFCSQSTAGLSNFHYHRCSDGNIFGGVNDRKVQQNGGCLIVDKGGGDEPLLHHISRAASDRVEAKDILSALDITESVPVATPVIMKIG